MQLVAWAIVCCEILFWVFIVAGLIVRYGFRREKLGFRLMAMSPVIDIVLLVLTVFDLSRGSTATLAHGLAAIYIGVSLAFGKQMIAWADRVYRRVILKEQVAKERISRARRERNGFYRHILAFLIGGALLGAMILWLGNTEQTESLLRTLQLWGLVLVIDGVISMSYTVFPARSK
ncbi:hypothetical protein [Exiguobacterium sp. Leaf196]|uniref:hypothetical protein n=1 Tax=Exiguobacterium sp. Leaf196 TaxID=1736298 RepID=UPI0006F3B239|nr:hypothetical protein [Exiguobacterium sp. Leaf196]KQS45400.1 hypothetical protein ASG02_04985 [Exiguobacterium sp. Leaf196]